MGIFASRQPLAQQNTKETDSLSNNRCVIMYLRCDVSPFLYPAAIFVTIITTKEKIGTAEGSFGFTDSSGIPIGLMPGSGNNWLGFDGFNVTVGLRSNAIVTHEGNVKRDLRRI